MSKRMTLRRPGRSSQDRIRPMVLPAPTIAGGAGMTQQALPVVHGQAWRDGRTTGSTPAATRTSRR
jgi:hypothetical protein